MKTRLLLVLTLSMEMVIIILLPLFFKFELVVWILISIFLVVLYSLTKPVILRTKNIYFISILMLGQVVGLLHGLPFSKEDHALPVSERERKIFFYCYLGLISPRLLYSIFFAYRNMIFPPWAISKYGKERILNTSSIISIFKKPLYNLDVKPVSKKYAWIFLSAVLLFSIIDFVLIFLWLNKVIDIWETKYLILLLMVDMMFPSICCCVILSRAKLTKVKIK